MIHGHIQAQPEISQTHFRRICTSRPRTWKTHCNHWGNCPAKGPWSSQLRKRTPSSEAPKSSTRLQRAFVMFDRWPVGSITTTRPGRSLLRRPHLDIRFTYGDSTHRRQKHAWKFLCPMCNRCYFLVACRLLESTSAREGRSLRCPVRAAHEVHIARRRDPIDHRIEAPA